MRLLLATLAIVTLAAPASATTYTFTTLNAPGVPYDINNSGQVVLVRPFYYADLTDSTSLVPPASYVLDTKSGTLTTISYPGSDDTEARTINNAGVVGGYRADPVTHDPAGFLRDPVTGAFTDLLPFGGVATVSLSGLNDAGVVVGSHYFSRFSQGFIYDTATATLTTLSFNPAGINDSGLVVGGPIYDTKTQTSTLLHYPDSSYTSTSAVAINDTGQVVGQAYRSSPDITVGFESISFVYDLSSKTYSTLTDPNGTNTVANGINDAGQVVGSFKDADGAVRAFLATPDPTATVPEPTSLILLASGVSALAWTQGRSRARGRGAVLLRRNH